MKKTIIAIVAGAAAAALSFLLAGIDSEIAQNIRWAMFTAGLITVFVGTVALVFVIRSGQKRKLLPDGAEYRVKSSLMSAPEISLYRVLCGMTERTKYVVLPQIALVSVIDKVKGGGFRNELFRIADFCIADGRTFEPLLLIELNDASHKREERKLRDDKVNAICEAADLPVLTIEQGEQPQKIRSMLKKYL